MGDQPKRVEEVTLRLAAIQDELLALSPGPSPERFQLLTERDALRETAATFEDDSDDHRSIEALQAELASLEHQRNTILDTRSGYVTSKGGSAMAPTSGAWVGAEGKAQTADRIERITIRISEIEDALRRREKSGE